MLDIKQTVNNTHGVDKLRIVNKISKMEPSFCCLFLSFLLTFVIFININSLFLEHLA